MDQNTHSTRILRYFQDKSFEDAYTERLAENSVHPLINSLKIGIKPLLNDKKTYLLAKNLSLIVNYIEDENISTFPRFIDLYLAILYKTNGIRKYNFNGLPDIVNICDISDLINDEDDDPILHVKELVEKFENRLKSKKWFNDSDLNTWNQFQIKRNNIYHIEPYLLNLQNEVAKAFLEESLIENFLEIRRNIYEKYIRKIKLIIAEYELFAFNLDLIPTFLKLTNYLEIAKSDIEFDNYNSSQNTTEEQLPIVLSDQEKFVYCYELGIIEFLKKLLKEKGQKSTDVKIYPLISMITGITLGYTKKLMGYANNPEGIDKNNPFKNNTLMDRVNKILINKGLKDQI